MTLLSIAGIVIGLAFSLALFYFRLWPAAILPLGLAVALVYRLTRTHRLERTLLAAIAGLTVFSAGLAWVVATPPQPVYLHVAGVAVAPDRIYLSDLDSQRIVVLDSNYNLLGEWLRGNGNPAGLAVDRSGRVIAAYPENHFFIRILNGQSEALPIPGGFGEALGQFRRPVDVATDSDQRIYVADADNDRVVVYGADGRSYLTQLANPPGAPMHSPRGVAVSPVDQSVYVADTYNDRVLVYTPVSNGLQFKHVLPLKNDDPRDDLFGPEDVAIRSNGEIIIADAGRTRVVVLDPAGQYLREFEPCPGCRPSQLALSADGNNLLIVDSTQNKLRVRQLNGAMGFDLGEQPSLPASILELRLAGLAATAPITLALLTSVVLAWVIAGVLTAHWLNLDWRVGVRRSLYGVMALVWPTRYKLGVQRVLDGKLVSEGALRQPGPLLVSIDGASAAVFERGGQISRVSGPGRVLTEPGEVLRTMFDLRVQTRTVDQTHEPVYSRDAIPLEVKLTLQYRLIQNEALLVTQGRYEVKAETLRRAALNANDWHAQTEHAARDILREVLTTRRIEEIFDPRKTHIGFISPRAPLQQEMRRRLGQITPAWGVEVLSVSLEEIRLPEAVRQRLLQVWDVEWNRLVEVGRAQTEVWALQERKQFERDEDRRKLEDQLTQAQLRLAHARNEALAGWEVDRVNVARQKELEEARAQLEAQLKQLKARAEAEVARAGLESELEAERWRLAHNLAQQPDQAQLDRQRLQAALDSARAEVEAELQNERWRLAHDLAQQPDQAQLDRKRLQAALDSARAEIEAELQNERLRLEHNLAQQPDLAQLDRMELRAALEVERLKLEHDKDAVPSRAELEMQVERLKRLAEGEIASAETEQELEALLRQAMLHIAALRASGDVEHWQLRNERARKTENAEIAAEVKRIQQLAQTDTEAARTERELEAVLQQAMLRIAALRAAGDVEQWQLYNERIRQTETAEVAAEVERIQQLARAEIASAKTEHELETVVQQAMLRIAALRATGDVEYWQLQNERAKKLETTRLATEAKHIEEDGQRAAAVIRAEAEVRRAEGRAQAKALLGRGKAMARVEYLRQLLNTLRDDERLLHDNPLVRDLVTRLAAFTDINDISALANFLAHEASTRPEKPPASGQAAGKPGGAAPPEDSS